LLANEIRLISWRMHYLRTGCVLSKNNLALCMSEIFNHNTHQYILGPCCEGSLLTGTVKPFSSCFSYLYLKDSDHFQYKYNVQTWPHFIHWWVFGKPKFLLNVYLLVHKYLEHISSSGYVCMNTHTHVCDICIVFRNMNLCKMKSFNDN
jgi:hypothetical protein